MNAISCCLFDLDSVIAAPIVRPARRHVTAAESRGMRLTRVLLSNMGMLSLHQKERFHAIDQTMEFYYDLKQLDLTTERECQRVGVLYVPR